MAKRGFFRGSSGRFLAAAGLIVAGAGVGFWLIRQSPQEPAESPGASERASGETVKPRRKVKIYVVRLTNDDVRLAPEMRSIPAGSDPHEAALQRLLDTNREVGPSQHLIPPGTKLLSVKVRHSVAYADFSRELRDNFRGGTTAEELLLNAIVYTLTQFGDVNKVQILVDGKRIDSIGGQFDISQPLAPNSGLLDQEGSE